MGGCDNTPISCDDGDACTADSCDAVTGCNNEPIEGCGGEVDEITVLTAKYDRRKAKVEIKVQSSDQPNVAISFSFTSGGANYGPFDAPFKANKGRYEGRVQGVPRPDGDVVTIASTGGAVVIAPLVIK